MYHRFSDLPSAFVSGAAPPPLPPFIPISRLRACKYFAASAAGCVSQNISGVVCSFNVALRPQSIRTVRDGDYFPGNRALYFFHAEPRSIAGISQSEASAVSVMAHSLSEEDRLAPSECCSPISGVWTLV